MPISQSLTRQTLGAIPESCLLLLMPCCPFLICLLWYAGMSFNQMLLRAAFTTVEFILWIILVALDRLLWLLYLPFAGIQRRPSKVETIVGVPESGISCARKTVVIVGGSFGGLAALRHLSSTEPDFRVVLVDQREFFEYTPGVLRLFCNPRLFWSMARNSPRGYHEFLLGTVTAVNGDHIMVAAADGRPQRVDFDYLILGTGADYSRPVTPSALETTLSTRAASWQKEAAKVASASSILVLGGGAVGVELAAEIVCHFPEKQVTIVDAAPALLPLFPPKVAQHAQKWFEDRGVELLLGEPLEKWDDSSCTTKSGRIISASAVYVCFGSRCNSQCVSGGSIASCLGSRKEVRVNDFLQVEGWPHVFAVGDVMSHPAGEIKQAYYAELNGKGAAMNVIRHSQGEKLAKYPDALAGAAASPLVYVVSLGRYDGCLGFNELVINGALAALVKWVIEWTKVREMENRPIGKLIWWLGDEFTFLLSRRLIKPKAKGSD